MPIIVDLDTPPSNPQSKRQKIEQLAPELRDPNRPASPDPLKATAASSLSLHPLPQPKLTEFIVDPTERVKQCVKVLCGNVGILADQFISLGVARQGFDAITNDIVKMLEEGFMELLKLPQRARAEAAEIHLKPLEHYMGSSGIYLHRIEVPPNASFWKEYEYAFDFDGVDTTKACVLAYIGSTARPFHQRVVSEHMQPSYRKNNRSLHYAAMDEPGAQSSWYLIAEAPRNMNKATVRIMEATTIATMHTFTLAPYTTILKNFGIVEGSGKAFGLNRSTAMCDWGMKTMDSPVQMVLYQRLLEENGGEPWSLDTLPAVVASWVSTLDRDLHDCIKNKVRGGTSLSLALKSALEKIGGMACRDASIARSIQKVLSGGHFRLGAEITGMDLMAFSIFNLGYITVAHPAAELRTYVSVNFIISKGTHALRWSQDAQQKDVGRRLAILVSGQDSVGNDWYHWCKVKGDKAATRANTYFDLITGTGY